MKRLAGCSAAAPNLPKIMLPCIAHDLIMQSGKAARPHPAPSRGVWGGFVQQHPVGTSATGPSEWQRLQV